MFYVLEDQVQTGRCLRCYQAFQFNYIGMIQPTQNMNFTGHEFDTIWITIIKPNLFYSYNFIISDITGLVNIAVSSLANLQE